MTDLLALADDLPLREFAADELLLEEGSSPGVMFVLESGTVVIEHAGVPFARIDNPGAVLGEMAAVLDKPATATVRAVGTVASASSRTRSSSSPRAPARPSPCCGRPPRGSTASPTTWST